MLGDSLQQSAWNLEQKYSNHLNFENYLEKPKLFSWYNYYYVELQNAHFYYCNTLHFFRDFQWHLFSSDCIILEYLSFHRGYDYQVNLHLVLVLKYDFTLLTFPMCEDVLLDFHLVIWFRQLYWVLHLLCFEHWFSRESCLNDQHNSMDERLTIVCANF